MSALMAQIRAMQILPGSLAIWSLGQMGLAVKGPGATIYLDACLSDIVRERFGDWWARAYPPPLLPAEIDNCDYCFISHEHLDHLDPATLGPLATASPGARFVTTRWCEPLLAELGIAERALYLRAGEPQQLGGIRVTAVPGAHYELEQDPQRGHRWTGFLIEWNGVCLYHAGDTVIYPGYVKTLRALPTPDVALLPMNGRDWYRETEAAAVGNLLPVEAARLAHDLGWGTLLVGHNDLYANNAIPMSEIVAALAVVHPRQRFRILQPGELMYFVK